MPALKSTAPPRLGDTEEGVVLAFVNNGSDAITVHWVDYDGREVQYATVQPGSSYRQATYATHPWRIKRRDGGATLTDYVGGCATISVTEDGTASVQPGLQREARSAPTPHPTEPTVGLYRQRGTMCGIDIYAYDCVEDAAVQIAHDTLRHMLAGVSREIVGTMVECGMNLAIIGRHQCTTDIPAHAHLKGTTCEDGRDYDEGTRGLGGNLANPVTSVGEENLLMLSDDRYSSESILVHEVAHAVMNLGLLGQPQRRDIEAAYKHAIDGNLYNPESYIASNSDEYWAEGSQAWFHATVRQDVTSGVISRAALKRRDPQLAAVLKSVWGSNGWRFTDTAPAAFVCAQPRWRRWLSAWCLPLRCCS